MIPKMDEMVHQSAVKIAAAADAGDRDAVVSHLSTMIKGCVACHQTFR
jgi:cytochrome c556